LTRSSPLLSPSPPPAERPGPRCGPRRNTATLAAPCLAVKRREVRFRVQAGRGPSALPPPVGPFGPAVAGWYLGVGTLAHSRPAQWTPAHRRPETREGPPWRRRNSSTSR